MNKLDKIDFNNKIKNKTYTEYYAMYLLESLFPNEFKDAKVKDCPDIWSRAGDIDIGVEVTTLQDTYLNTLKKYRRLWSESHLSLEQIVKQMPSILTKKIGINNHGSLILLDGNRKYEEKHLISGLKSTIESKFYKLQFYEPFKSQNLFIFASNLSKDFTIDKVCDMIQSIDISNYKVVFDKIMIFDYETLQIYNQGKEGLVDIYCIPDDTRFYCDNLAEMQRMELERLAKEQKDLKQKT